MSDLVGSNLGQYQIIERVGQGGMAQVYKAWQPSLQRYVALKVLAPRLASDASFVTRFHREAVSAANLKQTHIVIIHDVGTENGFHYIAMEYVDGTSLDELIRSQGALPLEQVVDITTQVGSALDYAHQQGFIHRDIKPANVLIDRTGLVVLTDFGIVKALSGSGMTMSLTQSDSVFGTPHYMSPEQVKDETLDHRSDLYSLGIVCYEMLAGQVPFNGATTHSILFAQAHETPTPLRDVNPEVPSSVEKVMNKMLSKEPLARYNSAGEFAAALSRASTGAGPRGVEEEPAVASRKESKPSAETPQRRHTPARCSRWSRVLLGVAVIGAVLALGALVAAVVFLDGGKSTEETLSDAQAALAAENKTEAAELFEQVLTDEPGNVAALDGLLAVASSHTAGADYDRAIATFKWVLDEDPDNAAALRGIGDVYETQQDWTQARDWYERWTQVAPEDGSAFQALGNAHFQLGEYEPTEAAYEQAEALGASAAEMFARLGMTYYEVAQFEKAVEWLEKAQELDAEDKADWAEDVRERLDDAYVENALQDVVLDIDFSNIVTKDEETYVVANTSQKVKIEGAVQTAVGQWEGSKALIVEEDAENRVSNPSFEVDLDGWRSTDLISKTSEEFFIGSASARIEYQEGTHTTIYYDWSDGFASGESYTGQARMKGGPNTVGKEAVVIIHTLEDGEWHSSQSAPITLTEGWQYAELVHTAEKNGDRVRLRVSVLDPSPGNVFFVDGAQLEREAYATSYVDGDQGQGYAWSGTPHAGVSTRSATNVNLDEYADLISSKDALSLRIVTQVPRDSDATWPHTYEYLFDAAGAESAAHRVALVFDSENESLLVRANNTDLIAATHAFKKGDWLDCVITLDYAGGKHGLFINGEGVGSSAASSSAMELSSWTLGSRFNEESQAGFAFTAFSVFDRILAENEVTALHSAAVGGNGRD